MKTTISAQTHPAACRTAALPLRRLISFALLLVLVVPLVLQLAGCNKKPAIDPDLAELAIYDVIEYEIGDQYSYVQSIIWANGEIIALASDNMGVNSLVRISPEGQLLGTVPLDAVPGLMTDPAEPSTAYLDGVFAGPSGSLLVTATDYSDPMKSVRNLYQMDSTGQVQKTLLLFEAKNDGSTVEYLNNIQATPDGHLLLVYNNSIRLIDFDGNKKGEYKLDGQNVYVSSTLFLKNGHYGVSYYTQEGSMVSQEVDLATGTKVADLALPPQLFNTTPIYGSDGSYYLNGYQYLSRYDEAAGKVVKLLSWLDLDVNRNNLSYLWVAAPDGSFYFGETIYPDNGGMPYNGEVPQNPVFKLLKLTKSADQSAVEKTNVSIGAFWINEGLRKAIIEYRKVRPDVRFTVVDYNENIDYSKPTAYEDAITKINADILAGKMPDILMTGQLPWQQYASKGLLVDLGEQMAKDKEFDSSLFLENVFRASSINGKLYTLTNAVGLTGIMSSRSLVGDRTGWTVQEFQSFVEQQPDPSTLFYQMPGDGILNMLLMGNLNAYIDTEKGLANFDSPDFIQLLEFAKKYGIDPNQYQDGWVEPMPVDGETSGPALQMVWMSRFEDYSSYNQTFKGEAVMLGLPSQQRSGPMLNAYSALAMAATSKNQDIIWDFFKFYLSEALQDQVIANYEGFPIRKSSLAKAGAKAIADTAQYGQEQPFPEGDVKSSDMGWWYGAKVTQADVDAVTAILSQADTVYAYDEKAYQLISEETQGFFAGNKSAAETAAAIQSRMRAYVGERQ